MLPGRALLSPGSHAPAVGTLCGMKKLTRRQSRQLLWSGIALQLLMAIVGFAVGYYHSTHDKWILGAVGAAAGMIIFDILVWVVGIPVALRLRRKQDQVS
jgi:membrane protein YdbS with pleckstrin-like domain